MEGVGGVLSSVAEFRETGHFVEHLLKIFERGA
jgi:hypothetical protein